MALQQNNVSNLTTSWQQFQYMSSSKPIHRMGVVEKFASELQELDTLVMLAFSSESRAVIPGFECYTWEQLNRRIPPVTMDTLAGLPSASTVPGATFTFSYTQNSTDNVAGAGIRTYVRRNDILMNPIGSRQCLVTNVTIVGLNNVTVTAQVTGQQPFVAAGTTLPAGTPLYPLGNLEVDEPAGPTTNMRRDVTKYAWGMSSWRESERFTGKAATSGYSWVLGVDGDQTFLDYNILNALKMVKQFAARQLMFVDPDMSNISPTNLGVNTIGACGMIPFIRGRSIDSPGGLVIPHGGFPTPAYFASVVRALDRIGSSCTEFIMGYDRDFYDAFSSMIKTEGGAFDLWDIAGETMDGVKGLNLDFKSFTYSDVTWHGKNIAAFNSTAGLNTAGSDYKNLAVMFPRKMVYDREFGKDMPAVEMIHSGHRGIDRAKSMWTWGNPHLLPAAPTANGTPTGTPHGSSGFDELGWECQTEWGACYRGGYDFIFAPVRA